MQYTKEMPNHLKRQRELLGMTQLMVANAAGIHIRQYQRLESGEKSMPSVTF